MPSVAHRPPRSLLSDGYQRALTGGFGAVCLVTNDGSWLAEPPRPALSDLNAASSASFTAIRMQRNVEREFRGIAA
jgi:hypothetical protein